MTQGFAAAPARAKGVAREGAEIVAMMVAVGLFVLGIRIFLFQPFAIPSASMEPSLYQGDYIVVSKYAYGFSRHSFPMSLPPFSGRILDRAPTRGDIVVFTLPRAAATTHEAFVKRLIGLPGDRIQVKRGLVFINGMPVIRQAAPDGVEEMGGGVTGPVQRFWETLPNDRTFLTNSFGPDSPAANTAVYVVPPHCYFMMGDNRDDSLDSRFDPNMPANLTGSATCGWDPSVDKFVSNDAGVGFVPEEDLVGRADIVLLSWDSSASLAKPWSWFSNFRPSRAFRLLK